MSMMHQGGAEPLLAMVRIYIQQKYVGLFESAALVDSLS